MYDMRKRCNREIYFTCSKCEDHRVFRCNLFEGHHCAHRVVLDDVTITFTDDEHDGCIKEMNFEGGSSIKL